MFLKTHALILKTVLVAGLVCSVGCAEDPPDQVRGSGKAAAEPSHTAKVRLDALARRGLRQEADAIANLGRQNKTDQTPAQAAAAGALLASLGFKADQLGSPECDNKVLFQAAMDFDRASADFEDAAALSEIVGVARFVGRTDTSDKGDGFFGETELDIIENWGARQPSKVLVRSASGVSPDGTVEEFSGALEPVVAGTYLVFASEALYSQAAYERGKLPASSPAPHVQLLSRSIPLIRGTEPVGGVATGAVRDLESLRPALVNAIARVRGCRG